MTIKVGDRVPSVELHILTDDGPDAISSDDIFIGKTVALFGLPGAYTRTCSSKHLPSFVQNAEALKAKGVHTIVCLSVNDPWVMGAWGEVQNVGDRVMMVGDGNLNFTRAAGLEIDMSSRGNGARCLRFSMLVKDGVVTTMHTETDGTFGETSAETLLGEL